MAPSMWAKVTAVALAFLVRLWYNKNRGDGL